MADLWACGRLHVDIDINVRFFIQERGAEEARGLHIMNKELDS